MSVSHAYYYVNAFLISLISLVCLQYRYEMEELKSDNVDVHLYHQHNQVEQLKFELDGKKMLFSRNCIKIFNVVGQGR